MAEQRNQNLILNRKGNTTMVKRITISTVRENIDARDAAKLYGLKTNRSGFALCPFHGEKTPSFKVYRDHYYCFGCQESGDVISLTMKLTGLDFVHAMDRLAADFGIAPIPENGVKPFEVPYERSAQFHRDTDRFWKEFDKWVMGFRALMDRTDPKTHEDGGNVSCYMAAASHLDYLDHIRESFWGVTDDKEKAKLVRAGLAYFEKLDKYREDVKKAIADTTAAQA